MISGLGISRSKAEVVLKEFLDEIFGNVRDVIREVKMTFLDVFFRCKWKTADDKLVKDDSYIPDSAGFRVICLSINPLGGRECRSSVVPEESIIVFLDPGRGTEVNYIDLVRESIDEDIF